MSLQARALALRLVARHQVACSIVRSARGHNTELQYLLSAAATFPIRSYVGYCIPWESYLLHVASSHKNLAQDRSQQMER